jgi:diguanylate cyclase (GGDEF)-like protein
MSMAWFKQSPADRSTNADGLALRDGLLFLLEYLQARLPTARRTRVARLRERLDRFPVPTGLLRELRTIRGELMLLDEEAPTERTLEAREVGTLADGLVSLARNTSLVHHALEERLLAFRAGLPRRMNEEDIRRVLTEADDISTAAGGMRRRAIQDREELTKMLRDMGRRLHRADSDSAMLGDGIAEVARHLSHEPSPEELATLWRTMSRQLDQLTDQAGSLRSQLQQARDRSRSLEDVIQRQADELVDVRARAALDPLTGVCNRGTFDKALRQTIQRTRNSGSPLSLVLFDIDHFKSVNDSHGHLAGDAVLVAFAQAIVDQVREDDIVGRYGGEEFAVILPGAGEAVASSVAERVRVATSRLVFPTPADQVHVTVSAGVAVMQERDSPPGLLRRADSALYAAKHGGRNQVRIAAA